MACRGDLPLVELCHDPSRTGTSREIIIMPWELVFLKSLFYLLLLIYYLLYYLLFTIYFTIYLFCLFYSEDEDKVCPASLDKCEPYSQPGSFLISVRKLRILGILTMIYCIRLSTYSLLLQSTINRTGHGSTPRTAGDYL